MTPRIHPEKLTDETATIQAVTTENGTAFVMTRSGESFEVSPIQPVPAATAPHNLSKRAQDRLKEEMEAGAKRIAFHAEMQARNRELAAKKSAKEIQAEGSSVPVFRPTQFNEYNGTFASNIHTKSKDTK